MSIPRYFDIDSSDYAPNQAIDEFEWYPYDEDSNNVANSTRYSIQTKNKNAMMRLAQARLEVKCKLTRGNGTFLAGNKDISPINSAWHLFSNVRALLNNQELYNSPYTGKEHLIRHLVHYDKEYAKTVGSQVLFYPDTSSDEHEYTDVADTDPAAGFKARETADGATSITTTSGIINKITITKAGNNPTVINNNPNYNAGFAKRTELFRKAGQIKEVTLWLPISEVLPFFADYDRIMTGVTFQLILNKNTQHKSYLFGNDTNDPGAGPPATFFNHKIDITGLKLWVPEVKPSISIAPELTERFLSSSRTITYRDVVGYRSPTYLGSKAGVQSWNVATTISKPLKAYVAFQFADRDTKYCLNSGEFDLLFGKIGLRVNGQYLPNTNIEVGDNNDNATGSFNYGRVLQEIHRAGGKDIDSDDSAIITQGNWADIYPIVVFDLEDKAEGLFKNNLAHIVLEWTKKESGLAANRVDGLGDFYAYMILETERGIKLDYAQSRLNVLFK